MKRLVIAMVCVAAIVYGCSKSESSTYSNYCSGPAAVTDSSALLAFASKYGITATADTSSWLFYQIINPGTGNAPVSTSKIYVRYSARFMDGTYFDSTATDRRFALDSLIQGWQYGLPKIKPGGQIKLLIPSALAYGCAGATGIPANAPVYFNIYLDSLK